MLVIPVLVMLLIVAFLASRGRILPLHLVLVFQSAMIVGYAIDDAERDTHFAVWLLLAIIAFALAYGVTEAALAKHVRARPPRKERSYAAALSTAVLLIIGLVVYHFALSGLALFSRFVEIRRFDFTQSGLWGIPGRMYLFGLPFAVFLSKAWYKATRGASARALVWASWSAYVLAQLFSGFKGSVVSIAVLYLLVLAQSGRPFTLWQAFRLRYAAVAATAIAFAAIIAQRYQSLGISRLQETLSYLFARLTTIAANAGYQALWLFRGGPHHDYYLSDVIYYLNEYSHLGYQVSRYPLELMVSSSITGTSLGQNNFIVSVTMGPYAEAAVSFGLIGGLIVMAAAGAVFAGLSVAARRATRPLDSAILGLAVLMFFDYSVNGGLAYRLVNWAAVSGFLWLLYHAALLLSGERLGDAFARPPVVAAACRPTISNP